ncbi:MAG: toll/interleukin-1 receptor domain-containing protein [Azospirillaceae bacterium]|nr:toll/interleukin-1 receptor domain-containing protein [Azospirillaceae bacterium]
MAAAVGDEFDVFISYVQRQDRDAVEALHQQLKTAGLRVWRDVGEIETFDDFKRVIERGLARSRTLLAYYSRHYPTRRLCQWELTAAVLSGDDDRVLVINPETTLDHIHPTPLRRHQLVRPDGADLVARRLHEQALEIHRRVQGDEHPDTLTSINNLAVTLFALGKPAAARSLWHEALEPAIRRCGEQHPITQAIRKGLALLTPPEPGPPSAPASDSAE